MFKISVSVLCVLVLLTACFEAFSQADTTDYSYYFDDSGISTSRNVLKTDVVALVHGEMALLYERTISDGISLEGGLGLLLPYYVHDFLPLLFDGHPEFTNDELGNSYWLQARWYPEARGPELDYWSLQYRNRKYSATTLTDISINMGRQKLLGDRLMIDYGFGIGVRLLKGFNPDFGEEDVNFTFTLPLFIRIGYLH